jgi:hypothetical protein
MLSFITWEVPFFHGRFGHCRTVLQQRSGRFKIRGYLLPAVCTGPVRLGVVIGGLDGYTGMNDGGWFLAAIPAGSIEYQRVGLNVFFVPSYGNRIYGSISFQLKLKVL